jgi:site-specific DNA-cytosine methylase
MRILLACEESQVVTKKFRELGHEAYSCDILETSGTNPEWHIQADIRSVLNDQWDMIIAFPPCTHLATSGAAWFEAKRADGRQQEAINFFMLFAEHPCKMIAIENPVGIMSSHYRKPDQIIQPWQFGDAYSKRTCLWLKNLPKLSPTLIVETGEQIQYKSGKTMPKWYADAWRLPPEERSKIRSRTFNGIAQAMADQWSSYAHSGI